MDTEELDQLVRDISTRMDVGIPEVRGPVDGLSHRVYELKYSSGEAWSLRIPKTEVAASISKRGLAVLDHLKKVQPTLWVPRPIYDSETYSLLSFLDGDTLGAWDSFKLTDKRRQQLLNSLATFLLDLWLSPVPQSACSMGYEEWLCNEIDQALRRSLPANSGWGDPLSFLCQHEMCSSRAQLLQSRSQAWRFECLEYTGKLGWCIWCHRLGHGTICTHAGRCPFSFFYSRYSRLG